ncbi:DUF4268 domain-containing protein [Halalkalicoccus subterraneus]|uniref:DUF4268 domain-containing protein n=1 Tax=Halalkalicoccus subterraneus TaxID=2675002 RepID=UPI000EFB2D01|nr:DUF4268 domain-containing protein [Halalkalicoccus subterraneus]
MPAFEGLYFQELEPQDVREYWADEARQFTPWLATEIQSEDTSYLEDVLELDLEVIEVEKRVGKYSVDILARVEGDGRNVVIENQLTTSDHDHLGKAIAYAAGVDADIIVWIAPQFNDEHSDAIQWLNDNSRERIDLFAIRLEVWKIGDSDPAVRFNPAEQPSEWKERARRAKNELSEQEERREEFWIAFRDRIEEDETPLQPRKPSPRLYYSNPIGKSGFHLSFVFNTTEDERYISLIIEDDEETYWQLEAEREQIEDEIGESLVWIEPEKTRGGNMRSQLQLRTNGTLADRDMWEDHIGWFLTYGERFYNVFHDRV